MIKFFKDLVSQKAIKQNIWRLCGPYYWVGYILLTSFDL